MPTKVTYYESTKGQEDYELGDMNTKRKRVSATIIETSGRIPLKKKRKKKLNDTFDVRYQQLVLFKHKFGHCNVSQRISPKMTVTTTAATSSMTEGLAEAPKAKEDQDYRHLANW